MSLEARCPQCVFVSRQLGQPTPCLLHASLPDSEMECPDYDEPYTFGLVHPTVDRPGPFSLREYIRLALRSRIQDRPPAADEERAQVGSYSRR